MTTAPPTFGRIGPFFRRWDRWWFADVPPHALAVARIALGLFLAVYALFPYALHAEAFFSSAGLRLPLFVGRIPPGWEWLFLPPPPSVVWLLVGVLFAAIAGFTLGFGMRACGIVLIALGFYGWQLQGHMFVGSYLRLMLFALLVLTFSGADRALSLRMRRTNGSWLGWEPACVLPQRLLALQITFTYLGVGWQKVILPEWQGGEVLAYSFIGMWATPPSLWLAHRNFPIAVYDAAVFCVTLWETILPLGLWLRRWRAFFFATGALFHITIAMLMTIWQFVVLIPLYVTFLEPESVRKAIESRR